MTQKDIVILGGSYGGVSMGHNVLKHFRPGLPGHSAYRVVLVSPTTHVMCRAAFPRAMISDDNQDKVFVSIPKSLFEHYGSSFRFALGSATGLGYQQRIVSLDVAGEENRVNI